MKKTLFITLAIGSFLLLTPLSTATAQGVLFVQNNNVGIGIATPAKPLHIQKSDGTAAIFVQEQSGTVAARPLFQLENNGVVRFTLNAKHVAKTWRFESGAGFAISLNGSGVQEMTVASGGNVTIAGDLVTGGSGTCNPGPCDGIFSPDFEVESIKDHADYMWTNWHLPGVGPTPEGKPINVTQKTTGILNELEKAHIYIEQLDIQIRDLQNRLKTLESVR